MKVGSLVVCVSNEVLNKKWGGIPPIIGEIYTVRCCQEEPCICGCEMKFKVCLVEEIINPMCKEDGLEYWHLQDWYKEIQPPMDLTELLEKSKVNINDYSCKDDALKYFNFPDEQ